MNAHEWMGSGLKDSPEFATEIRLFDAVATMTDEQPEAGQRDQLAPVKPDPEKPVLPPASTLKIPSDTVAGKYAVDRTVRPL